MENQKANKLVDKILKDLDESGINKEALIDDIKELRTYALEENSTFLIPILDDEPLEDEEEGAEAVNDLDTPVESLKYLIALTKNLNNKGNIADLREYKELFARY